MSRADISPQQWVRIRRFAIPGWMISECTAARERGDWRAACEAAGVEVLFDDPGPVADLLAGLAPDLLRWHLPRSRGGSTALSPGRRYVLTDAAVVTPETPVLLVRTLPDDRLSLDRACLRDLPPGPIIPVPAHLWDAREADGLRVVTTLSPDSATWADAGWVFTGDQDYLDLFIGGLDPMLLAAELRRVAAGFGTDRLLLISEWLSTWLRLTVTPDQLWLQRHLYPGGPTSDQVIPALHQDLLRPPPDSALVRDGHLDVAEVHPLVRAVLFPSAPAGPVAAGPPLVTEELFRVRCRGVWHWVGVSAGRIELPEHSDEERQREHSLAAFGGEMGGCFQAEKAWNGGGGRLPRRIRQHRRDLIVRLELGGARALEQMLDAGLNPDLRDGAGRTLIHMLRTLGDPGLLPRLLAAGLDIETRCRQGFTPLFEAVDQRWPSRYIIALVDAGADLRTYFPTTKDTRQYLDRIARHADQERQTVIAYLRRNL
ncbi:MAG TPA: hypothetical protein VN408_42105 [Actinoplanes sp.]|nr:hypothetical protein [Actinoplanes sp.]